MYAQLAANNRAGGYLSKLEPRVLSASAAMLTTATLQPQFVHFLHISNSGGTTVCRMVQDLLRLNTTRDNCNLPCKHPQHWHSRVRCPFDTCATFSSYLHANGWEFVASETFLEEVDWGAEGICSTPSTLKPLAAQPLCPQVSYVTIIKEPLSRIGSEVARLAYSKFGVSPEELLWSWLPGCGERGCGKTGSRNLTTSLVLLDAERCYEGPTPRDCRSGIALMGTPAISNYATRLLLGRRWFLCPPDKMDGGRALRDATQMLSHFSLVLTTDDLSSPTAFRALTRVLLRPRTTSATLPDKVELAAKTPMKQNSHEKRHDGLDWLSVANISNGLRQILLAHNQLDLHLYRLAKAGFFNRNILKSDEAFP